MDGQAVRRALALAFWLFAAPAHATVEAWPALYDVSGVAAGDVLNIRAEPTASAAIIGGLAPDRRGVEVIRTDAGEGWGLVNTAEGTGWVSLAYLARRPEQWDGSFPEIAACYGTEPFWGFDREAGRIVFRHMEAADRLLNQSWQSYGAMRRDRFGFGAEGADGKLTAILSRAECGDGMSDRLYGIAIDLIIETADGPEQYSGCCSLAGP